MAMHPRLSSPLLLLSVLLASLAVSQDGLAQRVRPVDYVMAGGQGTRLGALTSFQRPPCEAAIRFRLPFGKVEVPKPMVRFGSKFRLVDFTLGQLIGADHQDLVILTQYGARSLREHLFKAYSHLYSAGLAKVDPCYDRGPLERNAWARFGTEYKGTAHAVFMNADLAADASAVGVFAADHVITGLQPDEMSALLHTTDAGIVIAAKPMPARLAREFGVIEVNTGDGVRSFVEKPDERAGDRVPTIPGDPSSVLASMGNYYFRPDVFHRLARETADRGFTDFGKEVIPFALNELGIPIRVHRHLGGWRDAGTIQELHQAEMDHLPPQPILDLTPPYARQHGRELGPATIEGRTVLTDSKIARGHISNAEVVRSVLSPDVGIEKAFIDSAVVHDLAFIKDSRIRNAIIGEGSQLRGLNLGTNRDADAALVGSENIFPLPGAPGSSAGYLVLVPPYSVLGN